MRLSIGGPGEITITPGQLCSTKTGAPATPADVARAARGKKWVFLGENHATSAHQNLHADVISALVRDGRNVIVGLEMLTRPKQPILDQWTRGDLMRFQFTKAVDWKGEWGFPFTYYEPIFSVCRDNHVSMVALNVPREWVRSVGRSGFAGLDTKAKLQLPANMSLVNASHRQVFTALMGGHPMTGSRGENIYSAQVLWDEGMADTAIKFRHSQVAENSVFVVIAGSGHVMYRQGINFRIQSRNEGDGITVVMTQSAVPIQAAKGVGDFVFVSAPERK